MGLLRILLAISVIIQHSGQWLWHIQLVGGFLAVEIFFLLSGFYMALVLNTKYAGTGHYGAFLTSRFWRIFPAYWIITLLFFGFMPFFSRHHPWNISSYLMWRDWARLPGWTIAWLALTNISIIGQDLGIFLGFDRFSGAPVPMIFGLHLYYPNGISWTLALELYFYLIAPFIVSSKRITFWVFFLSLSLRIAMNILQIPFEPFILRFFPAQLCTFLGGVIAYQYRDLILLKLQWTRVAALVLAGSSLFAYHLGTNIEQGDVLGKIAMLVFFGLVTPSVFELTKDNPFDRYLGQLSYFVYMSHFFLHEMLSIYIKDQNWFCLATIVSTAITSVLLFSLVEKIRRPITRQSWILAQSVFRWAIPARLMI